MLLHRFAPQQFQGVGQHGQHYSQAFADAAGAARQRDNQRAAPDADYRTAQHRHWRELYGLRAHRLGDTGDFAVNDGADGLGGNIARPHPGAAGGYNQVNRVGSVGQLTDAAGNLVGVIVHNFVVDFPVVGRRQFGADGGAAGVIPLAARAGAADGKDGELIHKAHRGGRRGGMMGCGAARPGCYHIILRRNAGELRLDFGIIAGGWRNWRRLIGTHRRRV